MRMALEILKIDVNVTSLRVVVVETRRITVISPWVPLQGQIWRHYFCLAMVKDICRLTRVKTTYLHGAIYYMRQWERSSESGL